MMTTMNTSTTAQAIDRLTLDFKSGLLHQIAVYDASDRDGFAKIIGAVTKILPASDLADFLKVSVATVSRWQSGKSAPRELVREVMVSRLGKHISAIDGE